MIKSNILFLILFLYFPLSTWALIKKIKIDEIQKEKIFEKNKISKFIDEEESQDLGEDSNFPLKNIKQNKLTEIKISKDKAVKSTQNIKSGFYLNFAIGNSSLKNYDVYNTSTNKVTWDDRYTKLGRSFEIGLGYDFGKVRTEISYAQENGRFDEYLTYFNNSITKIDKDRGKLHKDFYIINSYYDFIDDKKLSPYIGLGFGFVNSSQDSAPYIPKYLRQVFVVQLKGGFSYKISGKNSIYIEGFWRDANSHTTNDGLGTPYIYEAKNGFDSSGLQIGFRKII